MGTTMEDMSSMSVGDTVQMEDDNREWKIVEKKESSVGKLTEIVVEPVDGGKEERKRISASEWADTWTA